MSYEKELKFATDLAREAGRIMVDTIDNTETSWKADNTPVTQADLAINELVINAVRATFPDDGILGEENSYEPDRPRKWVVDPIDGTQAYDLGVPLSTHCNGLVVEDDSVLGVVYEPFMDALYTAVKGEGAFLNAARIAVSDAANLEKKYVILSSRIHGQAVTIGDLTDAFAEAGSKYFNFRSIVYGYMLVARGKAVASVAGSIQPWDLAAAKVILEEAGAKITDFDGNPIRYDQTNNGVVVTNGHVHDQVLAMLHP